MAGTASEIVAGDFIHAAVKVTTGNVGAKPYVVSASNTVPSTPPVIVPVFDPTGTTPIAPMIAYDTGGKALNVKGSGFLLGLHTAGTVLPAASTAEGGPYPPQKDLLVMLPDTSIDMVGHGAVVVNTDVCIFGVCIGAGAILAGAAVAQFDAERVPLPTDGSLTTAFPILP